MSAQVPTLEISASKTPLPMCSPNLMPFHVSYTGPAPVSTYFRPKAARKPDYGEETTTIDLPDVLASDSQSTLVDEPSSNASTSQLSLASTSTAIVTPDVEIKPDADHSVTAEHLIAAFRGRTVRGLTVDLPSGYAGVVLSAPEAMHRGGATTSTSYTSSARQEAKFDGHLPYGKPGIRGSKQSREDNSEESDNSELAGSLDELKPVRRMEVAATFSSFVLWNADVPVDAGRDEYLRSLTEWTSLAAVVSRAVDAKQLLSPSLLQIHSEHDE